MNSFTRKCIHLQTLLFVSLVTLSSSAFAQSPYGEEPSSETFIFKLITGGFGAFVIIFFGLGGLGSLYLTRSGESSKRTPLLGVIMLLIAGITFGYRVMIRAGIMGHEHIQW